MLTERPPPDKYHLVYLIMLLHGVGTLMPWNMFITIAPAYFVNYKLMEMDEEGVRHSTAYSRNFFSYLGICSQLPCLLMNLINVFVEAKGGLVKRILTALIIIAVICVITIFLVIIDTAKMVTAFFFITMLTVIILNGANGIYQNSLYGLVSAFPQQFTNAIVLGNNLCGTFVSIISIFTLIVSDTIKVAALAYFSIALLTVAACFFSFYLLPKLEFYRYYQKKMSEGGKYINMDETEKTKEKKTQLYISVFKQVWMQCLNVFLVFFVTLSIFPAIMAEVKVYSANGVYDFFIPEFLFTPITTFLLFNLFALIGSIVASFVQWPSARFLFVPVVIRLLLIPLMMFCNYRPQRRSWPVYITSEYVYIIFGLLMSFTSGYFSSLGMMYAPRYVSIQSK
uniref:Equilibrative nucleoside transporter 1 n=1 Tax=Ascaris lumbricoides TaxID=6252 RepID=A0A0M3HS24_ASCLU